MASLQTSLLAAFILLAMVLPATEAGPYAANVEDSVCCQRYIRHALPRHVVDRYYSTSDSCRRPGVVLAESMSITFYQRIQSDTLFLRSLVQLRGVAVGVRPRGDHLTSLNLT